MKKHTCKALFILFFSVFIGVALHTDESRAVSVPVPAPILFDPTYLVPHNSTQITDFALAAARCNFPDPTIYGIAVGTVYCIKQYIYVAVEIYSYGLSSSSLVTTYQFVCYTLAIAFFGLRLMVLGSDEIIKDSMTLLIKGLVSVYLIGHVPEIYAALTNGMGEAIGFFGSYFTNIEPSSCAVLKLDKVLLTTVDSSVNYNEYQAWHNVDCLLFRMFGTTFTMPNAPTINLNGTNITLPALPNIPSAIMGSMVPIVAAAMFTSTIGMMIALAGLGVFFCVLQIIVKAIYTLLMSYMALALLVIFVPLFAPLLLFESHNGQFYTKKIFDRWQGQIINVFIQPIVITAYMAFSVFLIDAFIEGDQSTDPSVQAVFANCQTLKEGNDLCTFNQLYPTDIAIMKKLLGAINTSVLSGLSSSLGVAISDIPEVIGNYNSSIEPNPTSTKWDLKNSDPQSVATDCNVIDRLQTYIPKSVVESANQIGSRAAGMTVPGPTRLKVTPMVMLKSLLTFIAALIMIMTLYKMMDTIAKLASSIANQAGVGLFEGGKLPFEELAKGMASEAKTGMIDGDAKKSTGIWDSTKNRIVGGTQGAAEGILGSFLRR